ncbi:hypothetical protein ANN_12982 [Periplaneta americana]|uniref:Reverse transcriptase domain-containing protein n=1 Tax=Periplaneta americana TaxID=6978 RepID=A0ABQ8TJZ9_PERAM|nr:hypothetical protein ANN_12982 [Periplaneta americana]
MPAWSSAYDDTYRNFAFRSTPVVRAEVQGYLSGVACMSVAWNRNQCHRQPSALCHCENAAGVVFLYDNAEPPMIWRTTDLLQESRWEAVNTHPTARISLPAITLPSQEIPVRSTFSDRDCIVFIDLEKAYDSVLIKQLWEEIKGIGVSLPLIALIQRLYKDSQAAVKIGKRLSAAFYTTKGLRQGCSISPTLFKIYIQQILKQWNNSCRGMGIPVGNETVHSLLFADDQVIIVQCREDAKFMPNKAKHSSQIKPVSSVRSTKPVQSIKPVSPDKSSQRIRSNQASESGQIKPAGPVKSSQRVRSNQASESGQIKPSSPVKSSRSFQSNQASHTSEIKPVNSVKSSQSVRSNQASESGQVKPVIPVKSSQSV